MNPLKRNKRLRVSLVFDPTPRPLTLANPYTLTPKGLAAVLNMELQEHRQKVIARKLAGKRGLLS